MFPRRGGYAFGIGAPPGSIRVWHSLAAFPIIATGRKELLARPCGTAALLLAPLRWVQPSRALAGPRSDIPLSFLLWLLSLFLRFLVSSFVPSAVGCALFSAGLGVFRFSSFRGLGFWLSAVPSLLAALPSQRLGRWGCGGVGWRGELAGGCGPSFLLLPLLRSALVGRLASVAGFRGSSWAALPPWATRPGGQPFAPCGACYPHVFFTNRLNAPQVSMKSPGKREMHTG